ncbi:MULTISPECIES: hypothetical protein [Acinetobacter]|uniref:Uncharacterized protein n=1 Tax=Acinetobacter junii TaxID=40215 RepID=A0AAW5R5H7_ACIJU|nr:MULTISPECIES: hypothetical protein [Acinetobacter]MCR4529872.1 hypothetical protein [Acinetobacter venetianus]MCU4395953.1 hypothetical protein [Acinetobacter junii]
MEIQHTRVIVEINQDVQFSRFKNGDQKGGVQPIEPSVIAAVKAQLEDALLHLENLSSHR